MHVGVTEADPWVKLEGGDPASVEVELVERFAGTLGARIEWVEGSETELMEALHGRQLDVVIAGPTRRSEWQRVAALTRPYVTTQVVIAAPDRQTADRLSDDLGGERIAVEANTPEAAKLEEDTDALVRPVDDIAAVDGPVAVPDFLLDDLRLVRTDAELDEHAMAASMGENAFLVALERFLLDRESEAGSCRTSSSRWSASSTAHRPRSWCRRNARSDDRRKVQDWPWRMPIACSARIGSAGYREALFLDEVAMPAAVAGARVRRVRAEAAAARRGATGGKRACELEHRGVARVQ